MSAPDVRLTAWVHGWVQESVSAEDPLPSVGVT